MPVEISEAVLLHRNGDSRLYRSLYFHLGASINIVK